MNIWFEHPWIWVLFILIFVWALFFALRNTKNPNFLSGDIISQVYAHSSLWYYIFLMSLVLAFFCVWALFSKPYQSLQIQEIEKNGIDMVLVLDVSYSMLAKDIYPDRLTVAKWVLSNFLSELEQDRVWLVVFAGKPFQSIPLVYDYSFIQDYVSHLEGDTIPQENSVLGGTAIGDALVIAQEMLEQENNQQDAQREKVIILLTDGEANVGVDPNIASKLLAEHSIKTYTIGIWGDEAAFIDIPLMHGFSQRTPIAWVDEKTLKNIAKQTGWKYFRAKDEKSFHEIFYTISQLEKRPIELKIREKKSSFELWLRLGLLLCILLQLSIICKKRFTYL